MRKDPREEFWPVVHEEEDAYQVHGTPDDRQDRSRGANCDQGAQQGCQRYGDCKNLQRKQNSAHGAVDDLPQESQGHQRPDARKAENDPYGLAGGDHKRREGCRHEGVDKGVVEALQPRLPRGLPRYGVIERTGQVHGDQSHAIDGARCGVGHTAGPDDQGHQSSYGHQGCRAVEEPTCRVLHFSESYPVHAVTVHLNARGVTLCVTRAVCPRALSDKIPFVDYSVSDICGWRRNLDSDNSGEFWIDREALTQRMSKLSPTQRAFFRWGIVEEFNKGLEQILEQDQAVGEMREDFRDQ